MEPIEGALELTECSKVSLIAVKVGSTKFTDTALGNNFIPYYSGKRR